MDNLEQYFVNNEEIDSIQYDPIESSEEDTLAAPDESDENFLYNLSFELIVKKFKTQTSARTADKFSVSFDTLEEFTQKIWNKCVKYIKKEIIIDDLDTDPVFSLEEPAVTDFDKFIQFYDPIGKKLIKDPINLPLLHKWKKKTMKVYVYPHSDSVYSNDMFKFVSKKLLEPFEKDRGGACANSHIETIIEKLKATHSQRLFGFDINWRLWGSQISNSESHLQQELILAGPPPELIRNFRENPNRSEVSESTLIMK